MTLKALALIAAIGLHMPTLAGALDARPEAKLNPGSVTTGKSFVVYDAGTDAGSACAPYLDSPILPLSFPTANHQDFEVWTSVVSPFNNGTNYWLKGRMSPAGAETSPFHVACGPILPSAHQAESTQYSGSEWLIGLFKQSEGSIYGIVHNEYYGGDYPKGFDFSIPASPRCNLGAAPGKKVNPLNCTYTTLLMAVMGKGESSFKHIADAPKHVIARPSFDYVPDAGRVTGYFTNTNIVKNSDGYYYVMTVDMLPNASQRHCPIRTSDLSNPSMWKGWNGTEYSAEISKGADCAEIGVSFFPFYLGYSSYFEKFIMVGGHGGHISYEISSDMIHWSEPVSFGIPLFDPQTGDWSANNYPSLMDPAELQHTQDANASSGSVVGQRPWLVFVQHKNPRGTRILGVPVTFSK